MVTAHSTQPLAFSGAQSVRSLKVLIADDEAADRDAISTLMKAEGHEVRKVVDGSEVLDACTDFRPDLAILDIAMNDVSGLEAMVRMKASPLASRVPVIIVSKHCGPDVRAIAIDLGASECLPKPWSDDDMRSAISRAIA